MNGIRQTCEPTWKSTDRSLAEDVMYRRGFADTKCSQADLSIWYRGIYIPKKEQ